MGESLEPKKTPEITPELVQQVRELMAEIFEDDLKAQGPNWINRDFTTRAVEKLRNGERLENAYYSGELWASVFPFAIGKAIGVNPSEVQENPLYEDLRKKMHGEIYIL